MNNRFNNVTVKTKLIVFNIIIVIFALITIATTYIIVFNNEIIEFEQNKREDQTVDVAKEIEYLVQSAYMASGNFEINNEIFDIIENYVSGYELKFNSIARKIIAVNSRELKNFTIYLETDKFSSTGYIVTLDDINKLSQYKWGNALLSSNRNIVLCAWKQADTTMLSIVRYTFLESITEPCICRFDINIDSIYSILNSSSIVQDRGYTGLLYNNEEVLKRGTEVSEAFYCEFSFSKYNMMRDFKIVTKTPIAVITEVPHKTIIILVSITAATVVGLSILLFLIISPINKRLKQLKTAMVATNDNVYKPIDICDSNDEIGQSIVAYNKMVNKINEMFEQIYRDAVSKTKLESDVLKSKYISLKSQIDPHFIYNVLNSIYSKSIIKGEEETAKIILTFSKMLRENLIWKNDMLTIEEERENIDRYIAIQKYRYEDGFDFSFDCPDELYELSIPKMTILTLVENSFKHVVENVDTFVNVRVKCVKEGEYFSIGVFDNGQKLTEEEISDIYQRIERQDMGSDDPNGINNILSRMKYYYEDVNLSIENTFDGKWFTIKFRAKEKYEAFNS